MFPVLCRNFDLIQLFIEGGRFFPTPDGHKSNKGVVESGVWEQREEFVLLYYECLMPRVAPAETKMCC